MPFTNVQFGGYFLFSMDRDVDSLANLVGLFRVLEEPTKNIFSLSTAQCLSFELAGEITVHLSPFPSPPPTYTLLITA